MLIERVWEQTQKCKHLDETIIATDDERIQEAALHFGAQVVMTSSDHLTGTDRIAQAIEAHSKATHIINIQGDEPLIDPHLIDELAQALIQNPEVSMATAANCFDDPDLLNDPNVVKVVLDKNFNALYFSRSPLPFQRDLNAPVELYRHKGIYAYRRDFLEKFVTYPPSALELAESLEQLRALENGAKIRVIITEDTSGGIDTLQQAQELQNLIQSSH